ncbi:helix-turn-helix domain-containing protein [Deinococcus sp.]|uniref:helix-turn-helix domain-containing protein n=1 Tax=Deinococcus sp. TaxID=47478 RepID=UPI003B5B62E4
MHQTREELEQAYRSAERSVERSRWQILWLRSKGKAIKDIIEVTGFGRTTISTLIHNYNAEGPQAVVDKRQFNMSEPALNDERQQQLFQALQEPPETGGSWTSKKVQQYIKKHFDLEVTEVCGWGYLRRLGFTVQVPRPTHIQAASPEKQQVFIKK